MFIGNDISNDVSNWIDLPTGGAGKVIPVSLAMTILQNAHDNLVGDYGNYDTDPYQVAKAPGVFLVRDVFAGNTSLKSSIESSSYLRILDKGVTGFRANLEADTTLMGKAVTDSGRMQYSTYYHKSWILKSYDKPYDSSTGTFVFKEYDNDGNYVEDVTVTVDNLDQGSFSAYTRRGVTNDKNYWIVYRNADHDNDVYRAGYISIDMGTQSVSTDEIDSGDSGMSVTVYSYTNGTLLWRYIRRDSDGYRYGEVILGSSELGHWYEYDQNNCICSGWGLTHDLWAWEIGTGFKGNNTFWAYQYYGYDDRGTNLTDEFYDWNNHNGTSSSDPPEHWTSDGWRRDGINYYTKFRGAVRVYNGSTYFCMIPILDDGGITSATVSASDPSMNTSPLYSKRNVIHITDTCYIFDQDVRLLPDHKRIGYAHYPFDENDISVHKHEYIVTNDEINRIDAIRVESVEPGVLVTNLLEPPLNVKRGYLITSKYEPANTSITVDILNEDNTIFTSNIPGRTVVDVPNKFKLRFTFNINDPSQVCDPPVLYAYSMLAW